jgi:hypothetical protein
LFLLPPILIMMTSIYQRTERCSKTLCCWSPRNAFVCELWSRFWLSQNANGIQSKQQRNSNSNIVIPTEIRNFKVSCMNGPTIQQALSPIVWETEMNRMFCLGKSLFLLLNGSSGIAVDMVSNHSPHTMY